MLCLSPIPWVLQWLAGFCCIKCTGKTTAIASQCPHLGERTKNKEKIHTLDGSGLSHTWKAIMPPMCTSQVSRSAANYSYISIIAAAMHAICRTPVLVLLCSSLKTP